MRSNWQDKQRGVAVTLEDGEKRHGIVSLSTGQNVPNMVREPYFLMNIYRVLADGKLWTIARDEPFEADWRDDGVTLRWNPTETLPAEMTASYTVDENAAVTLRFWVKVTRDLKDFEISVGSYFDFSYEPYGVINIDPIGGIRQPQPLLWKAEEQDFIRGHYVHLPRDDESSRIRMDGRWNNPDTGKTIAPAVYGPKYAFPAMIMVSAEQQIYVVQDSSREACNGVTITYSSKNEKDSIRNHNATYFTLFGEDLKAGDEREAVMRQVIVQGNPNLADIEKIVTEKVLL